MRSAPFQRTTEVGTKFVPVTVMVKAASPALAEFGVIALVVGTGLFTVKVWLFDDPPPGAGLKTVTAKVPAVATSGAYLSRAGTLGGEQQLRAVARIQRGAAKMDAMIRDLLEYTRTRLGRGIPVAREDCSIADVCDAALDEVKAVHPQRTFCFEQSGDLSGAFDSDRLQQVFGNLLNNAVQHGAKDSPVLLAAHGGPDVVSVQVKNYGPPIPEEARQVIFNPLVQAPSAASRRGDRQSTSLGLGLFIARSIVVGHGGTLEVESSEHAGTVFTARFPRAA